MHHVHAIKFTRKSPHLRFIFLVNDSFRDKFQFYPCPRLFDLRQETSHSLSASPPPPPFLMARDRDPLPAGASIILFLLLILFKSAVGSGGLPLASPSPRPPLIVPLHFHRVNSSRAQAGSRRLNNFHVRRYLQEEHPVLPNAHMRLYDNLLTNG
jgi:hypothetical protein